MGLNIGFVCQVLNLLNNRAKKVLVNENKMICLRKKKKGFLFCCVSKLHSYMQLFTVLTFNAL